MFLIITIIYAILTLAFILAQHSWAIIFGFLLAAAIGFLIGSMREPFPCVDLCPECGHCEIVHAIDKEPMDPDATIFCTEKHCRCER